MPRGPKGEKRPADVIGNAVHVMRIATGEAEEDRGTSPGRAKGGRKDGKARARSLTAQQRSKIAQAAAAARWKFRRHPRQLGHQRIGTLALEVATAVGRQGFDLGECRPAASIGRLRTATSVVK